MERSGVADPVSAMLGPPHVTQVEARLGHICVAAVVSDRPFFEKLQTYEENPVLRQQAEISSFLTEGKPEWKAEQIDRRREKIVSFAVKRWDFDTVR